MSHQVAPDPDQPMYSIGAVARMLDIPASTLRAWEDRYSVITPVRSEGSQRLYSRAQVEKLRFVKAKMDDGMSAADAHRLLSENIRGGGLQGDGREAPDRSRPLILVAEPDPYAADLAEHFLRAAGFEVLTARDADEARLRLGERRPDLVVLDLLISGGAGFRLLDDMAVENSADVIAVAPIDSAEEAMRAGAAAFMRKPLEPLALVSAVRDLVGTRSSRR